MRYLQAAKDAGLRRALVSSSHNAEEVLEVDRPRRVHRGARRRPRQGRAEPARQARAGHVPRGGQTARRARRTRPRSSRTRWPASPPGAPGTSAAWSASTASASARRCSSTARTSSSTTSPSSFDRFDVEPWSVTEDGLDLGAWPARSPCSRSPTATSGCAGTSTRVSRSGSPGTYLNGFYETRPLPYAEAGYGYPEDGQTVVNATNGKLIRLLVDDEPFDIRYGELLKHVRTLDLRAGQLRRVVRWRSPSGREIEVKTHADRLLHAALGGGDPLRGAPARRQAGACRRAVRARGQRAGRRPERGSTRRRGAARAADGRGAGGARPARRARAPHQAERAADGRGHRPRDRGRSTGSTAGAEAAAGPRARVDDRGGRARHAAALRQVPGLRLVEPPLAAVGARPGRRRRGQRQAHGLGGARARRSASTWTPSGTAPTSRSKATRSSSRPSASRSSTRCRPAPAPSGARSRPRA